MVVSLEAHTTPGSQLNPPSASLFHLPLAAKNLQQDATTSLVSLHRGSLVYPESKIMTMGGRDSEA